MGSLGRYCFLLHLDLPSSCYFSTTTGSFLQFTWFCYFSVSWNQMLFIFYFFFECIKSKGTRKTEEGYLLSLTFNTSDCNKLKQMQDSGRKDHPNYKKTCSTKSSTKKFPCFSTLSLKKRNGSAAYHWKCTLPDFSEKDVLCSFHWLAETNWKAVWLCPQIPGVISG